MSEIAKATFPYMLYSDIGQLENAEDFPPYDDFVTNLGSSGDAAFSEEFINILEKNLRSGFWEDLLDVEDFYCFKEGSLQSLLKIEQQRVEILQPEALQAILHTSPKRYFISKIYFDENCRHMKDFLKWYNLLGRFETYFVFFNY